MRELESAIIPPPESLYGTVLATVAYSGIFDYPLSRDEMFRCLVALDREPGVTAADVDRALDGLITTGVLESDDKYVYPAGRCDWVATRLRRRSLATGAWVHARRYGRLVWMLPYVRMVAVTGALAMNNVDDGDDIDFFVVVKPGRLWLTRGMILVLVKLARTRGAALCPNFILSTRALRLEQRDLYTAHEIAQMVPLHGTSVAERFLEENAWYRDFLPNASGPDTKAMNDTLPLVLRLSKALGQGILDSPVGTVIEQWEQRRKIDKLMRRAPDHVGETRYTEDVCKGHADGHGSRVMERWSQEVERLSIDNGGSSRER